MKLPVNLQELLAQNPEAIAFVTKTYSVLVGMVRSGLKILSKMLSMSLGELVSVGVTSTKMPIFS